MDPAIKKIRDTFIRKLGDEMRADGFDNKRIAWLLGPEAVDAPARIDLATVEKLRLEGASWASIGARFGLTGEAVRTFTLRRTSAAFKAKENAYQRAYYRLRKAA